MKVYALYDKDNQCAGVFDNVQAIADSNLTDTKLASIYSAISRGVRLNQRYKIRKIELEANNDFSQN